MNNNKPSKALKIGIDLRQLIIGSSGGITQLVKGVCEHMFALYPEHQFLVFCTPFNRSLLDYTAEHVRYFSLPIATYFQQVDCIAKEQALDVLFRAYPMEDILQFPLCKQIVLIPDNQHETFPDFFTPDTLRTRRVAFSKALKSAGAIGSISEFARNELQNYPGTFCKDIFLMEPSLQVAHKRGVTDSDLNDVEKGLIPSGDYFLFPANLWKHKNHKRLLEAFRLFLKNNEHRIELIFTGNPSDWQELSREYKDLPVRHLGFVSPELLRILFERAKALVFFSLYEGFGMPLLEAFDAGTPVICSNTTSLPEVGGEAVLTCPPTDTEAMAILMEQILTDEKLKQSLIVNGKARLNAYSWERSAHNLIAACVRVNLQNESDELSSNKPQQLSTPLVSIVTPSFNQGRFLRRTIESVLSQSYPNIEYVVIDGGSTDESVDILRSYGDRFYWESEKDKGQTDAINKGLSRVNGEILAYLNSDDILLPGAIETVVRFFQQNPDCEMVYGNADYIDKEDQFIAAYKTAEYSFDRLMYDCMICQPAAFWCRSVIDKIGCFDEQLNFVMDYDYWIRIAKAGSKICFIHDKLACSRLYPETKTLSSRSAIYKEIFSISHAHTGYVNASFYQGYWHHLIHECNSMANIFLRIELLDAYIKIAWLHHKWDHRNYYRLDHIVAFCRRQAICILNKLGGKQIILDAIAWYKSFFIRKKTVTGFYSDNWIADKLIIAPKKYAPGQVLYMAGVTPQTTVMTIYANNKIIKQFDCLQNERYKVEFSSGLVSGQSITIQFTNFLNESVTGRKLAFLLEDTNIFSEQDTW